MRPEATKLLLLIACGLFLVVVARAAQQPIPAGGKVAKSCIPRERDALLSFKEGITNDTTNLLSAWRQGHDCCRWTGVTCSNKTGHVTILQLHDAPLEGQICPSLLSLEHLEILDLSNTSLQGPNGTVPDFFGSLQNLRYLDISDTPLVGIMPSFLGNLSKLQSLDLSGTLFSGRVPPQLGNLSSLQNLDLSGMQNLYSTDLSWLSQLQMLEYLVLDSVNLSATVEWPHVLNTIPSLEHVSLIQCSLSSANQSIDHLNLTKLTSLLLDSNSFGHPIATCWFWNVTSIEDLALYQTYLYGPFPDELGRMTSLAWLDFSYNDNAATMEVDLKDLCALEYLWLEASLISGNITGLVEKLPRCPSNRLKTLALTSNNMIGTLPDSMGHLTSLVVLDLSNNSITGDIPSEIGHCTNLDHLHLDSNQLDGHIPTLPRSLKILDLSMNSLSGPLPVDFGAPNILEIILFSNYFTGKVPESICHLQDLVVLDIASNLLHGELPLCFHMPNMVFLLLSNNRITGKFPSSLRSCVKLAFIDLAQNKLYGTLPPWIGDLKNLQFLQLSNNMFYGDIPINITSLRHLQHLSLASNSISGTIPWSISNLTGMTQKFPDETTDEIYLWYRRQLGPFDDRLSVVTKRQELKYGYAIFEFFSIDLSFNNITGRIPENITSLGRLLNLNLSWNHLGGKISENLGDMTFLESLDISRNNLYGEIPTSLSNLSYLGYLDLSFNNFSGKIPSGRQLDTLYMENPFMYDGNSELCGPPLTKICSATPPNGTKKKGEKYSEQMFFYFGLGLGFVVGLWVVFCTLLFNKTCRVVCFRFQDNAYDRVYVFVGVTKSRLARQSYC